jgi:hypothetical protein
VHYEAFDVYKQHSSRILGVTQIPNPAYAIAIATTSQVALQTTIAHHGTMPNNLDLVPTSINLSPQQLIAATVNIPATMDAPAFADLLHQPNHHILLQRLKRCTRLHPSYLLVTTMAILPTKLVNTTILLRISFVIIMRKREIKKLIVLPSS